MITLYPKSNLELLVEEVPEDAQDFRVQTIFKPQVLFLRHGVRNDGDMEYGTSEFIELNSGNYSFIATTKDISEEQAAELMDLPFSPKEFLLNKIRQAGGDPSTKNFAILKKL